MSISNIDRNHITQTAWELYASTRINILLGGVQLPIFAVSAWAIITGATGLWLNLLLCILGAWLIVSCLRYKHYTNWSLIFWSGANIWPAFMFTVYGFIFPWLWVNAAVHAILAHMGWHRAKQHPYQQ